MMSSEDQQSEIRKRWGGTAASWQRRTAELRDMFGPITAELISAAEIEAGDAVLDVAGGTGEPALTIVRKVGPMGAVMCTDIAQEMLEVAQHEALLQRLENVAFYTTAAESLPFDDAVFDAVTCRLGAMFFSDPVAAVSQMLRVAKPGSKIAFAVWSGYEENPFFSLVDRFLPWDEKVQRNDGAPGAFMYGEPGRLSSLLEQVGTIETTETIVDFKMRASVSLEEFWPLKVDLSSSVKAVLADLSEADGLLLAREVTSAVKSYFDSGQLDMPARVLIVSGRKRH
jgi:SAM-dependent methyltransferase